MLTHLAPPPPEAGSDEAATEPTAAGKAGPAVPKGAVEVVDLSELEEDSISVANAATTAQIATPGASKASNAEKAAENTPAVANGAASAGSSKKPAGKSAPSSSVNIDDNSGHPAFTEGHRWPGRRFGPLIKLCPGPLSRARKRTLLNAVSKVFSAKCLLARRLR